MYAPLDISVILPVLNGALTIEQQLTALADQEWSGSWEVVVVDNGSVDDTAKIVSEFSRLHPGLLRMEKAADRHNLSYVRNEGVRRSSSRWVAFCDADDVVGAGWLGGIAEALEAHPLVGSRLDFLLLNGAEHGARQSYQTSKVESILGIPVIAGGCMGCHRSLWESLGGNDERMLAEDTDFSIRAHLEAGVTPILADAVYHCRLRSQPRSEFRRGTRQARSEAQIYKLYGSVAHRPSMRGAARRWLEAISSVRHIRTDDGRLVAARRWGGVLGRVRGSIAYRTLYL